MNFTDLVLIQSYPDCQSHSSVHMLRTLFIIACLSVMISANKFTFVFSYSMRAQNDFENSEFGSRVICVYLL